ncbi:PhnD/SsuA/transferrin family substrate-binding protein [Ketobacter alkanivorans]|uniref:Solute-binding protein family 3/N-terminal domain-containing protein n=1 Tax=Ketobacter alkanivorans TaxID=1917421 RepID=A0A2K9LID2_9GAMM|nr:hypothetical protein [Ketobacter alkanivorans]AUM11997.1 hypothetical protein Kalk_05985 [Ketobacter alkanivorans]
MPATQSTSKPIPGAVLILIRLSAALLLFWGLAAHADTITVYHYNPESQSDRSLVLKNTFDRYFQAHHNVQLQPVDDRDTFQQQIKQDTPSLYIMSDWHYRQLASNSPRLVPYLRGLKNGQDTFFKLLVGKGPLTSQRATISVSGTDDYVTTLLQEMRFTGAGLTRPPRLLTVPKDIDALLAVGFGLADAALTTESSFEKLSLLYRNEYQQLKILGRSTPQKRLVVVLIDHHQTAVQPALDALEHMNQTKEGRLGLNLLGLDEWTRLTTTQLKGGQP